MQLSQPHGWKYKTFYSFYSFLSKSTIFTDLQLLQQSGHSMGQDQVLHTIYILVLQNDMHINGYGRG